MQFSSVPGGALWCWATVREGAISVQPPPCASVVGWSPVPSEFWSLGWCRFQAVWAILVRVGPQRYRTPHSRARQSPRSPEQPQLTGIGTMPHPWIGSTASPSGVARCIGGWHRVLLAACCMAWVAGRFLKPRPTQANPGQPRRPPMSPRFVLTCPYRPGWCCVE